MYRECVCRGHVLGTLVDDGVYRPFWMEMVLYILLDFRSPSLPFCSPLLFIKEVYLICMSLVVAIARMLGTSEHIFHFLIMYIRQHLLLFLRFKVRRNIDEFRDNDPAFKVFYHCLWPGFQTHHVSILAVENPAAEHYGLLEFDRSRLGVAATSAQ